MAELAKSSDTLEHQGLTHAEIMLAGAYVQHLSIAKAAAQCGLDEQTARRALAKPAVAAQVTAMIELRAEAMATTADWTIARQKELINAALRKGDFHAANTGLKHLGEFHGLWGKRPTAVPGKQVYDQRRIIFVQNDQNVEENLKLAEALNRDVAGLEGLDPPANSVRDGADQTGEIR